jgi:formate-dependent nitrite reductase membrane component NrfD
MTAALPLAEHFVRAPDWHWYILLYFFLAGLSGGSYAIATMLRLWGQPEDEPAARIGFWTAFPLLLLCPIFLTVDLGQPLRFWHMMVDTTPGVSALNFKYWSPMSVGVWALVLYGLFTFISFVEVAALDRSISWLAWVPRLLGGGLGRAVNVLGTVMGIFIAAYTGVLLAVSNQPVWSDSFALGGLFVASGMSGAAALLALLLRYRPAAAYTQPRLALAESYFAGLELVVLVVFFLTLGVAGTLGRALALPWLLLWVVAVLAALWPLSGLATRGGDGHVQAQGSGAAALARPAAAAAAMSVAVLIGVLALRMAVIWSAQ